MTGPRAAVLLAVASLSCLLSSPVVSAASGAEVAGGAAHRKIERIAGDPFLAPSGAPRFLIFLEEFLLICLTDCLWIVIGNRINSGFVDGILREANFGTFLIGSLSSSCQRILKLKLPPSRDWCFYWIRILIRQYK